ncbi:MAG: DNA integrity scanning protein DisA nucleotide-binding domain protein [Desulfobacterales bacterium]|nr:DNA integrity scanning protein DisA nucleotide-binding domain protein [Desulfobacterales bacterium]
MPTTITGNMCIFHALDGLRNGLCHFSGPSRAALLFALAPDDPVQIYDPQNLLRGHEPKFEKIYLESDAWRSSGAHGPKSSRIGQFDPVGNLQLTGLISHGGRSASIFYQMWFTEQHPDMCAVGPTERWLEHAAWLLSQDFSTQTDVCSEISGYVLRGYATHAVRDYLLDEMNRTMGWDSAIRVYEVLDTVLEISRTREEGAWPRGALTFAEPQAMQALPFITRFPTAERPVLNNAKHVRKLLQAVEDSGRKLVSDGQYLLGIADRGIPRHRITADFQGGHGFLRFAGMPVCSFAEGTFHSTTHHANLVQVEEILIDADIDPSDRADLFRIVSQMVHLAEDGKFGCTLVLDLYPTPIAIPGQNIHPSLDLRQAKQLDLACALAKVDGALHIGADLHLHRFACLLDGRTIPGEDRSRGARFNSALRFTAERPELIVVVVSADRPVAIIQAGVELSAQCDLQPAPYGIAPPRLLDEWIAGS